MPLKMMTRDLADRLVRLSFKEWVGQYVHILSMPRESML